VRLGRLKRSCMSAFGVNLAASEKQKGGLVIVSRVGRLGAVGLQAAGGG